MVRLGTRWRRIAAIGGIVIVVFGVVGALAIPAAARWGLETVASRELGRTVRVEAAACGEGAPVDAGRR